MPLRPAPRKALATAYSRGLITNTVNTAFSRAHAAATTGCSTYPIQCAQQITDSLVVMMSYQLLQMLRFPPGPIEVMTLIDGVFEPEILTWDLSQPLDCVSSYCSLFYPEIMSPRLKRKFVRGHQKSSEGILLVLLSEDSCNRMTLEECMVRLKIVHHHNIMWSTHQKALDLFQFSVTTQERSISVCMQQSLLMSRTALPFLWFELCSPHTVSQHLLTQQSRMIHFERTQVSCRLLLLCFWTFVILLHHSHLICYIYHENQYR